jgi:Bacterial Ig-like domain (group 3)
MRSRFDPTRRNSARFGPLLVVCVLSVVALTAAAGPLFETGSASAAVSGSKTKIAVKDCSTASCLITFTIKGVVKAMPTGTVNFLVGGSPVGTSSGACSLYPVTPLKGYTASATCNASSLPAGRVAVTVDYSGDSDFNPQDTTKKVRVQPAAT